MKGGLGGYILPTPLVYDGWVGFDTYRLHPWSMTVGWGEHILPTPLVYHGWVGGGHILPTPLVYDWKYIAYTPLVYDGLVGGGSPTAYIPCL